jgi:hypothetical protein
MADQAHNAFRRVGLMAPQLSARKTGARPLGAQQCPAADEPCKLGTLKIPGSRAVSKNPLRAAQCQHLAAIVKAWTGSCSA